jgi:hypothetical protein
VTYSQERFKIKEAKKKRIPFKTLVVVTGSVSGKIIAHLKETFDITWRGGESSNFYHASSKELVNLENPTRGQSLTVHASECHISG